MQRAGGVGVFFGLIDLLALGAVLYVCAMSVMNFLVSQVSPYDYCQPSLSPILLNCHTELHACDLYGNCSFRRNAVSMSSLTWTMRLLSWGSCWTASGLPPPVAARGGEEEPPPPHSR